MQPPHNDKLKKNLRSMGLLYRLVVAIYSIVLSP